MENYSDQIKRIKAKLPKAKKADKNFKVSGASNHKYILNKPIGIDEVTSFEEKFAIQLPECYKSFILQVGNGGKALDHAGAGPFHGIYPLGKHVNELIYNNTEKYLKNECLLKPNFSDQEWEQMTSRIYNGIPDEEYEKELGKIYGGIMPLGSQDHAFLHGLILNGKYKGRVVNINLDEDQKPRFTFEANFLDWYERWLDEIISGDLLDSQGLFGHTMGGSDTQLIQLYQNASDETTKLEALDGLLGKKELSTTTLEIIEKEYLLQQSTLKTKLLQILTKFDYAKAKKYLIEQGECNLLAVFQFVFWYARDKSTEWESFIQQNIHRIDDPKTFEFCTHILIELNLDYGELITKFARNENEQIRLTTIYTLGKLENKEKYIDIFIHGLNDHSIRVIHATLQALSGVKDQRLLKYYKTIAEKFLVEQDSILVNLNHRLAEFGLDASEIRAMDTSAFEHF